MKKNFINSSFIAVIAAVSILSVAACSKDNGNNNNPSAKGSFVVDGNNFSETKGIFQASVNGQNSLNISLLAVYGTKGSTVGEIGFYFSGAARPAAGSYTLVNELADVAPGKAFVLAVDSISKAKIGLFGGATGTITVKINSGKMSVSMPTLSASGSYGDITDPNNTKYTNATVNVSADVSEQ